jgi:hypothetical protein
MAVAMSEFVYFIRCEAPTSEAVKIGLTANLDERIKTLGTASPWPLTLIRSLPGSAELERELHRVLAEDRMHGEWFRPSERLETVLGMSDDEIRALRAPEPEPPRPPEWSEEAKYWWAQLVHAVEERDQEHERECIQRAEIMDLCISARVAGASAQDLAEDLGVTRQAIYQMFRKAL